MKATLDHVGIAVADLDAVLRFYGDVLGLDIEAPEEVPSQRVRVRFARPGAARDAGGGPSPDRPAIELLEATAEDSPVARFLGARGPGLHHVALRVDDIRAALAQLKARGIRLIDDAPRPGAHGSLVAFVHPASAHGVLVELTQRGAAAAKDTP